MKIVLTLLLFIFAPQTILLSQDHVQRPKVYLAKIYLNGNTSIKGIFYQIDDSSIQVYEQNIRKGRKYLDSLQPEMNRYSYRDIQKIKIVKRGRVGLAGGAAIGLASGIAIGAFTGFAMGGGFDNDQNSYSDLNSALGLFGGGILGGLIGLPLGATLGKTLDPSPHEKYVIDGTYDRFKISVNQLREFAFEI